MRTTSIEGHRRHGVSSQKPFVVWLFCFALVAFCAIPESLNLLNMLVSALYLLKRHFDAAASGYSCGYL